VVSGSERLSHVAPDGYELYNNYGMSESPLLISSFKVDRAYENTPIGKVVDGLEVLLVSEDGVPGDEGEVCLAGDIFLEYLKKHLRSYLLSHTQKFPPFLLFCYYNFSYFDFIK